MSKHASHGGEPKAEEPSPENVSAENPASGDQVSGDPVSEETVQPEAETETVEAPEEKLASLEAQLAEAKDQYLRKAAEFENFRKRMNREKQDTIEFANQNLLLDLIPIMDDFERAIKAAETSQKAAADFDAFLEGISMIEKRLGVQLENKWGLKRFDSAGEIFDPNRHEAIMMDKSPEITEPVVQEDFLKGYTLKDRVVRSAKVKVLMPEVPAGTGGPDGEVPPENQENTGGDAPAAE
ncbi:MAG: nucleotide exchange factor GrpE [Treponema sp.]|jgi:molecular chaperone GrpE|nr:nucleotide exchange factor GrpE [Treponema sp.]